METNKRTKSNRISLITRNKKYIYQPHGNTCTKEPMISLLGNNSFTKFGNKILQDTIYSDNKNLSPLQKLYIQEFKKQSDLRWG